MTDAVSPTLRNSELPDNAVIERVIAGETALYELLVRRYNQRVYRAVRAILRDDNEAEDVMQDAYVRAYVHLHQFEHRATFSTWITRIAVHEALARLHKAYRTTTLEDGDEVGGVPASSTGLLDPEEALSSQETKALLEQAIMALPRDYRTVVILRDVEEMNTTETAAALELSEEAVKVRLHRARAMLRKELYARAGATSSAAFQFHASRCDRVAAGVAEKLGALIADQTAGS
jgi:RNA polymerase sigma-70 factor, ECF subfamily